MPGQRRISLHADPRYQGLVGAILTLLLLGSGVQIISQLLGQRWLPALASGLEIVFLGWLYAARKELIPLRGRRASAFGAPALLAALGFLVMSIGHWN